MDHRISTTGRCGCHTATDATRFTHLHRCSPRGSCLSPTPVGENLSWIVENTDMAVLESMRPTAQTGTAVTIRDLLGVVHSPTFDTGIYTAVFFFGSGCSRYILLASRCRIFPHSTHFSRVRESVVFTEISSYSCEHRALLIDSIMLYGS